MATDATGTPTSPDSIPKFNTAVDAPSGLGFNAAMDAIQTALNKKLGSTDSPATNELPVWDGAAWQYQKISAANFASAFDPVYTFARAYPGALTNTTTETDMISSSITGGTIGAKALHFIYVAAYTQNSGGAVSLTVRIKMGGSTRYDGSINAINDSQLYGLMVRGTLWAEAGASGTVNHRVIGELFPSYIISSTFDTDAETVGWRLGILSGTQNPLRFFYTDSWSMDNSTAQTFALSLQWASASASATVHPGMVLLTVA